MGQNLSRRGSRINIPVDLASDEAQRLQHLSGAGDSNKEGSDIDQDEEKEDEGQAAINFLQHQQRHERHAEVRGTSSEVEARRQQLIENLIGMGFPIDWSLRAAEHCDVNVSESAAIAWIIERMELEHAKMEEMDGGEDSRMVEDMEESEDNQVEDEQGATAFCVAQHRSNFGYQNSHGENCNMQHQFLVLFHLLCIIDINSDEKLESSNTGTTGSGTLLKQASRQTLGNGGSGGAGQYSRSSKVNQLNHDTFTGSACSTGGYQDQGTWNDEIHPYTSILVGHDAARRRFDMDKQAVLSQISELDFCDLFPIVLSCQFSLCIFYARCSFVRILRIICDLLSGNKSEEDNGNKILGENYLKILLEKPEGSINDSSTIERVVKLLEICFKQGQCALSQPDKLFPSLLQVRLLPKFMDN